MLIIYAFLITSIIMFTAFLFHHRKKPKTYNRVYLSRSFMLSFINTWIVMFFELSIGYYPFFQTYTNLTDHSFLWFIFTSVVYFLLTDLLLWCNHYLLHSPYLFRWIHSVHHIVNYPTAFDFASVHPIEMLLNFLTIHFLTIFFPIYLPVVLSYGTAMSLMSICEHGTGLDMYPINRLIDVNYHNTHHLIYRGNYGVGLLGPVWDILFNTYLKDPNSDRVYKDITL